MTGISNGSGQVVDGETIYSVYSLAGTLVHRDFASQGKVNDFISLAGRPLVRRSGTGVLRYVHADHLTSPAGASDAAGALKWREDYTPFGEARQSPGGNTDRTGFTGHVTDDATGLTYMQARYYDPVAGRFLSSDPVGFADGGVGYFNGYVYTGNDPVNAIDPTGKFALGVARVIARPIIKQATKRAIARGVTEAAVGAGVGGTLAGAIASNPGDPIGLVNDIVTGLVENAFASDNQGEGLTDGISEGTRKLGDLETIHSGDLNSDAEAIRGLSDQDLIDAIENPSDGQRVKVREGENRLLDGNTRIEEAQRRFSPDTEITVDELPSRENLDPY